MRHICIYLFSGGHSVLQQGPRVRKRYQDVPGKRHGWSVPLCLVRYNYVTENGYVTVWCGPFRLVFPDFFCELSEIIDKNIPTA